MRGDEKRIARPITCEFTGYPLTGEEEVEHIVQGQVDLFIRIQSLDVFIVDFEPKEGFKEFQQSFCDPVALSNHLGEEKEDGSFF